MNATTDLTDRISAALATEDPARAARLMLDAMLPRYLRGGCLSLLASDRGKALALPILTDRLAGCEDPERVARELICAACTVPGADAQARLHLATAALAVEPPAC